MLLILLLFVSYASADLATKYTFYRIALVPSNWRWAVYEITLYSDVGCTVPIPVNLSDVSSSGYLYPPTNAFDGNIGTNWGGRSDATGGIWIQVAVYTAKPLCVKVIAENLGAWTVQGFNVDTAAFYSLLPKPIPCNATIPTGVLVYPTIYIPPAKCVGFCSTDFRVRQKPWNGSKWFFSLYEVEMYADTGCTLKLPYSTGVQLSVSLLAKGVVSSAFDLSPSTSANPWTGIGGEWAAVTFPYPVSVQCVKVLTDVPSIYIDATDPTGVWTSLGGFAVTPNAWNSVKPLTYPADNWSPWSACSQVCGSGNQTRTCLSWKINQTSSCPADGWTTLRSCNTQVCNTRWSDWSLCSKGCGGGIQTRTCLDATPTSQCTGSATTSCNTNSCLAPTGVLKATDMPLGATVDGEFTWTIRITGTNYAKPLWPARFYTATCGSKLAVSWTEGVTLHGTPAYGWNLTKGHVTLFQASGTGTYSQIATQTYPACKNMHGLDYTEDCTKLFVLCRGAQSATFNLDLVQPALSLFPFSNNFIDTASAVKDYMYIYQITNDVLQTPEIWIVSKAIRGWEFGNNLLKVHKPANQYLSFVLKTGMCVLGQPSNCHEGSTYMQVDFVAKKITRGDPWACANGHTLIQRLAYNRKSNTSLEVCGTDGNYPGIPVTFGVWSHRLDGFAQPIASVNYQTIINPSGGPGGMTSFGTGFVATIATNYPLVVGNTPWSSSIGLVFMDQNGAVTSTKWLSVSPDYYVNYPNVATLPNGNLLVGWAEMSPKNGTGSNNIPMPQGFRVAEFNSNGVMLTDPIKTDNGWGSVDNWDTINGNPVWVWAKGTNSEYSYTSSSSTLKIMTYVPVQLAATESTVVGEVGVQQQESSNTPQQGSSNTPQQGSSNTPQQGSSNTPQQGSSDTPQQGSSDTPQQGSSNAPASTVTVTHSSDTTSGLEGYQVALVVMASVILVAVVLVVVLTVRRSSHVERA